MTSDPSFYLRAAAKNPAPAQPGASGYFSAPQPSLDPNLFEGEHLKREVRHLLLSDLTDALMDSGLDAIYRWLHAWIAGSGISYQWAGDRGNGDLDVLFGIEIAPFMHYNPQFQSWDEAMIAEWLNTLLKTTLWERDQRVGFGEGYYEVTYFYNPGTADDITAIHPYAAYDIIKDEWAVRPPQLPEDPRTLYPQLWFESTERDADETAMIAHRFDAHMSTLHTARPGSAEWHSAGATLNMLTQQAQNLFTDIHTGRRAAFSQSGKGYGDYHNFRWQRGKELGTTQALHRILTVAADAKAAEETELYGKPIDGAEVALRRAAMQHQTRL